MTSPSLDPCGHQLRAWRRQRGLSQMALAARTGTSTRHLSFIETGRAHPSRALLLRLAAELDVPLRARNMLLETAGYAAHYRETGLSAPEMAQVRTVLEFMLRASEPYPAMLIDRYWNVLRANEAMQRIASHFARDRTLVREGAFNLMRLCLHPDGLGHALQNWREFKPFMLDRVRRAAEQAPADERMQALLEEIAAYPDARGAPGEDVPQRPAPLVMTIHLLLGEVELRMFTTIASLGAPRDITLQELQVECAFPADGASDDTLRRLAGDRAPAGTARE